MHNYHKLETFPMVSQTSKHPVSPSSIQNLHESWDILIVLSRIYFEKFTPPQR